MASAILSAIDVDLVLRSSENRTTLYEGRDADPESTAHALARHYLITNAGLADRLMKEGRNGTITFFAAFVTRTDMIEAARRLLNSPVGVWARDQLTEQAATDRRPRGSHTGMRAVIEHQDVWSCQARYPSGTGMMPATMFRMLLDRVDERPLKLHIHTFFPALQRRRGSWSEVKYRDGSLFARWP